MRIIKRGASKRRGGGRDPSFSVGEESLVLQMQALKIKGWIREHKFHPTRRWRFDFAFVELKLAVEVEGGTMGGKGRHSRGTGYEKDCEKYAEAALLGWFVIRVTTRMVQDGRAIALIERALNNDFICIASIGEPS